MQKTAIIFGLGPSGLFLSRQLHKLGYTTIGIGKKDDIGQYSNTIKEYYIAETPSQLKDIIDQIINTQDSKLEAYICSDHYLTLCLEHFPDFFHIFNVFGPNQQLFELIADKKKLIDFCSTINIKFPTEFRIQSIEEIYKLTYPIIVKPNIKRGDSPLKKIYNVDNPIALQQIIFLAEKHQIHIEDLILQQYISGNNEFEYGYGGYFKNGTAICDICFYQLRQYPQGVCCYTLEITDSKLQNRIKEQPLKFIQATNYSGFLQFDIKEDASTNKLYTLDINPRPWGSISMLSPKCKTSILSPDYCMPKNIHTEWRFPLKELMAFTNSNNVTYKRCNELKKGINYTKVYDLYDSHDIKPFFKQLNILFRKILIRTKSK